MLDLGMRGKKQQHGGNQNGQFDSLPEEKTWKTIPPPDEHPPPPPHTHTTHAAILPWSYKKKGHGLSRMKLKFSRRNWLPPPLPNPSPVPRPSARAPGPKHATDWYQWFFYFLLKLNDRRNTLKKKGRPNIFKKKLENQLQKAEIKRSRHTENTAEPKYLVCLWFHVVNVVIQANKFSDRRTSRTKKQKKKIVTHLTKSIVLLWDLTNH